MTIQDVIDNPEEFAKLLERMKLKHRKEIMSIVNSYGVKREFVLALLFCHRVWLDIGLTNPKGHPTAKKCMEAGVDEIELQSMIQYFQEDFAARLLYHLDDADAAIGPVSWGLVEFDSETYAPTNLALQLPEDVIDLAIPEEMEAQLMTLLGYR